MDRYLVESYLHDAPGALAAARARAQEAADPDGGVRHVRTTFLPQDEFVLDVFEAPTADALARALTRAGISFDRITEAAEPQEHAAREAGG